MKAFTISSDDHNIIAYGSKGEAAEAGTGQAFTCREELAAIIEAGPAGRLAEVWNSLPGVTPVNKFKDRKTGLERVWKAIQSLQAPAEGAQDAPKKGKAGKKASRATATPTGRQNSKKGQVIELLRRPGGATLQEIVAATYWQPHTVRGFVSGTLGKRMGLEVASTKREDGARAYALAM